jgi:hypothetical protein
MRAPGAGGACGVKQGQRLSVWDQTWLPGLSLSPPLAPHRSGPVVARRGSRAAASAARTRPCAPACVASTAVTTHILGQCCAKGAARAHPHAATGGWQGARMPTGNPPAGLTRPRATRCSLPVVGRDGRVLRKGSVCAGRGGCCCSHSHSLTLAVTSALGSSRHRVRRSTSGLSHHVEAAASRPPPAAAASIRVGGLLLVLQACPLEVLAVRVTCMRGVAAAA